MNIHASTGSLQDKLDTVPSIVDYLYANQKGSPARDAVLRQPPPRVQPEYTSWRDEQRAWREGVAFYNQSFHMISTVVRGKDAKALFQSLAVNNLEKFGVGKARHYIACGHDGNVVGDGILTCQAKNEIELIGRAAGHKWLEFNALNGNWDVELECDDIFSLNPNQRRRFYRYQVEGPNAASLLEKLNGAALPDVPRTTIVGMTIAGHKVWGFRMAMAGGPGYEIWGAWDEGEDVKAAILGAGPEFGLRQVGSFAYYSTALELGWIARPMHAIYTSEEMRPFREWLPASSNEVRWALGGSLYSPNIEDYYFNPYELGYGHLVKFDHDFVGRAALERIAGKKHRRRVTLIWDAKDVTDIVGGYMAPGETPPLYLNMPVSTYATWQYDAVRSADGTTVGAAVYSGFSWNERKQVSVAVIDADHAEPGTRLSLLWGEPDGGAKSHPWLEPHRQVSVGVTVAPAPINTLA
ncbi:aminomethyl transferase family protein [Frigidibacter sp. SD6-1]|uniref:aminomethyl transferase family protein n=1 Tax=Frigidibacter sp. SD6-1 TaxID=3032581 RepID=UPI0024DFE41D|nr:aminomethyl transferase family protein [Frigidibacter sp. SD6-1]